MSRWFFFSLKFFSENQSSPQNFKRFSLPTEKSWCFKFANCRLKNWFLGLAIRIRFKELLKFIVLKIMQFFQWGKTLFPEIVCSGQTYIFRQFRFWFVLFEVHFKLFWQKWRQHQKQATWLLVKMDFNVKGTSTMGVLSIEDALKFFLMASSLLYITFVLNHFFKVL